MSDIAFVVRLFYRILHGERYGKATPEELRNTGAALNLAGLVSLILLSLDSDTWLLPPVILWAWVLLSLFPLAVFFLWVRDYIPLVWSLSVGVSIPVAVFACAFLCPPKSVPVRIAAGAGLILDVALMVTAGVIRRAR